MRRTMTMFLAVFLIGCRQEETTPEPDHQAEQIQALQAELAELRRWQAEHQARYDREMNAIDNELERKTRTVGRIADWIEAHQGNHR